MRSVGWQINEERFAAARIRSDGRHEAHRFVEPDIGAIPVKLLPPITVEVRVVEIVVRPEVGDLR